MTQNVVKLLENASLQVVNASAGSGKTYSLVKTYIQLLLLDEGDNSERKYAEILAMTFTNKAAQEMKSRIVKALDELAYPTLHGDDYLTAIAREFSVEQVAVQKKAQRLLTGILHQYEDFYVMTIDKFNLRLIRSFSHDLDLPIDFEVVLDETPVIELVVDQILEEVGKNQALTELVFRYAQSNIEQEKSWNLRRSLIDFGQIISKEQDLPYVERLMNMEFSTKDYQQHWAEIRQIEQQYQQKASEIIQFFHENAFDKSDFSYGQHIVNAVTKLHEQKKVDWKEPFIFSASQQTNIDKASEKNGGKFITWSQKVNLFFQWYTQQQEYALILQKYLANYFNMALLKYMNKALLALNKQERLIRISEFNTKIAELLQEDTPFIYEKLGTRFRHFMLDEFQDTSRLQWLNLIPLIEESLAKGDINFIVGDPKQAIYRFKNGVAEQFVELPGIYNPENIPQLVQKSAFFRRMGNLRVLEDNWRSASEIVAFNNQLFEQLKLHISPQHQAFYRSVTQHPKSTKTGYVYLESEPKVSVAQSQESALKFIFSAVADALQDGFQHKDICILGRGNRFCNFVAFELTQAGYSVVSSDSLNIDSENTVRFILAYLQLRLQPKNPNRIRQFVHLFCEHFDFSLSYYLNFFPVEQNEETSSVQVNLDRFFEYHPLLKAHFFDAYNSLYDLLQQTFRLFELDELKNPYIHHLADLVHLFERRKGPDLALFLQEYSTMSKDAKALQIPESEGALKVMTIHKSKGLEFPVVIVVNDMKTSVKGDFFVQTNNYLLRSRLSSQSVIDAIDKAYQQEDDKLQMDTLNLYYVAYTRPTTRLYIYNNYDKKGIGKHLHVTLTQLYNDLSEQIRLEIGAKTTRKDVIHQDDNLFVPQSSGNNLWFPDIALQDQQTLQTEQLLSEEVRYGNQFHLIVAHINDNKKDVSATIERFIQNGQIERAFQHNLQQDMNRLLSDEIYIGLFEDAYKILNERTLIVSRTDHLRPDKIILKKHQTIVMEYKTGRQHEKHMDQLQVYCSIMQQMNFPDVRGYLVYVWNKKVAIVEGDASLSTFER